MKIILLAILTSLFFITNTFASNTEKLFYLTPDVADSVFSNDQILQIKTHAKFIDIIAPQIYELDEHGVIWGNTDSRLLTIARENNIKLMPLVTNQNFNQEQFHNFLHNTVAQERAISKMLALCKKYNLYGLQFDFENIHMNDKNDFTKFFQLTADRLHQKWFYY